MALIKGKQIKGNTVDLDRLSLVTASHVLVADSNGQIAAQEITGDAAVSSAGAITIGANAINAGKIAAGAVTFAKLSGDAISSDLSSSATATELARADAAKAYADARYTAATQYADSVAQGLDVKQSVRVATAGSNIDLSADLENGDSIDGVVLATGDRVLVKDQTTASENGIYVVVASGAASRADDAGQGDLTGGCFVFVEEGASNADNGFVCTTDGVPTIDTDAIAFAQFSGAGSVTAGAGLTKTGNQLDVAVDDSTIEISGDALQVKANGINTTQIAPTAGDRKSVV